MSKFKVGDRVKYVGKHKEYVCGGDIGKTGNVTDVFWTAYYNCWLVSVYYDDYSVGTGCFEDNLEHYEPTPQITVGSKWRNKDGGEEGFIAEVVSIYGDWLKYDSNHYPGTICPYNVDDWLKYMELIEEKEDNVTQSIITETVVKSVKAGVYDGGSITLKEDVYRGCDYAIVTLEDDHFHKERLGTLIETLKQIHEVM